MEFEEIINNKKDGRIDLSTLKLNPTTVLPLLCECKNKNLKLTNGENAFEYLKFCLENNKLFSKLPESRKDSDESDFLTKYVGNLDSSYGSYFVLRHLISELANNVYDHSKMENTNVQSYIFSDLDENLEKLSISIIDDGLSIPKLFENSNVEFDNDCHAIGKAISIFSTVSDTIFERGNGLRTIVRLIGEGNGGEFLLVSRKGVVYISGEQYKYYLLKEKHIFNGTLVSIKLNKYEIQNIYELLEPQNLNLYKYTGVINDY